MIDRDGFRRNNQTAISCNYISTIRITDYRMAGIRISLGYRWHNMNNKMPDVSLVIGNELRNFLSGQQFVTQIYSYAYQNYWIHHNTVYAVAWNISLIGATINSLFYLMPKMQVEKRLSPNSDQHIK